MNELKEKILDFIKDDKIDTDDVKKLLDPLGGFTNERFMDNIQQIVDAILEDRDGDMKITMEDIKLLRKDWLAISSIVKGIILVMNSIPNLDVKYDAGATEEIVFKMLVYIFLIIIPEKADLKWSQSDKEQILDIALIIYEAISSSEDLKKFFAEVLEWFKEKGGLLIAWMKKNCCTGCGKNKQAIIEEHLPAIKSSISIRMDNIRTKVELAQTKTRLKRLEVWADEFETEEEN